MSAPPSPGLHVCIVTHAYPRFAGDLRANFIESLARAYTRTPARVTVLVPYAVGFDRALTDPQGIRIVHYRYAPFASQHTVGYGRSMKDDLRPNLKDVFLMPFLIVMGAAALSALLKKEKIDVIHAHWAVPNALIALLGRMLAGSRAAVFTSFPGSDVTVLTRLGALGRILARWISRSNYLSCNSSDLQEDLVKAGIPKDRIDLVIYGVDDKTMSYSAEGRASLRREWGLSENDRVLLMVGRFVPKKGFSTAFRSLKQIVARHPDVMMVVVGDGPQKSRYLEILREDGTGSRVKFIGEIPTGDLRRYYSACDLFLMPSERLPSDGLNVVVPEAMACGRAIVASSVGGNDLVVFPGINGCLVKEKDPNRFSEAVVSLLDQPARIQAMGEESRRLVQERFNWDAIAAYYLGKYRNAWPN